MIKIDSDVLYEREEIAQAFPGMDKNTLTRCILAWGGTRPYPGSRKLFIIGQSILKALGSPQTGETPLPGGSGTGGSSLRPRAQQSICEQRLKAW